MPAFTFFQDFAEQIGKGVHTLSSDTIKVGLTNTAPNATDTIWANITEITAQNGYSAGGGTLTGVTYTESGGTATFDASNFVWTASGGSFGPARYVVFYNDTATSPADALIGYVDRGSSVTVNDGETLTVSIPTNIFTLS